MKHEFLNKQSKAFDNLSAFAEYFNEQVGLVLAAMPEDEGQYIRDLKQEMTKLKAAAKESGASKVFVKLDSIVSQLKDGVDVVNLLHAPKENQVAEFHKALTEGNVSYVKAAIEAFDTADMQEALMGYKDSSGGNLFHSISPEIPTDILSGLLDFKGAKEALNEEVRQPGSKMDGLTPLLSIVLHHGVESAQILSSFIEAGADIFAVDKNGRDLSAWVNFVITNMDGGDHPVFKQMQAEYEIEGLLDDIDESILWHDKGLTDIVSDPEDSAISDMDDTGSCSPNSLRSYSSESSGSEPTTPIYHKDMGFSSADFVPQNFTFHGQCSLEVQKIGVTYDVDGVLQQQ